MERAGDSSALQSRATRTAGPTRQFISLPNGFWRVAALAVFVALVCLRMPGAVHSGRFWAEEGAVYYARAWALPWWEALWSPYAGYLSLLANAAGLLARYVAPLHDAPHVTTAIALVIQALPAAILVTARDAWLSRPAILFAAILILAMPPVCDEVWLNTANSQFHLTLAAALCLALEVPKGPGFVASCLLLFLTPLSSPGSIALAPLFIARTAIDRNRARAIQAACLATGSVLQLAMFYTPVAGRGHMPGPATMSAIFAIKHLAIPFLGEQKAILIADSVHGDVVRGHYPIAAMLAVGVVFGLLVLAVVRRRHSCPAWLLAGGSAVACLSYYGAIGGRDALIDAIGSQRYAFAPSMLFALAVLALAATAADRIAQASRIVVIWLLAIATQQTILPQDAIFVEGPGWKAEIARWRNDKSRPLSIWPIGWVLYLPPQADAGGNHRS